MISTKSKLQEWLPTYKICQICKKFLYEIIFIQNDPYYVCKACNIFIKWTSKTAIHYTHLSLSEIETLVLLFVQRKSATDVYNLLSEGMLNEKLSKSTVLKYMELFARISVQYYLNRIDTC